MNLNYELCLNWNIFPKLQEVCTFSPTLMEYSKFYLTLKKNDFSIKFDNNRSKTVKCLYPIVRECIAQIRSLKRTFHQHHSL